uniref:NADH-ubiquinone oxidoreductase chain 2 n=1 Tax=Aphrophora sp. EMHAU-15062701 TaxID=2042339 RepID=A0A343KJ96_9HEMI|nr:NADH dehydrogenase subunit 2 [Aphrophora sp. EMHAU-15062701]
MKFNSTKMLFYMFLIMGTLMSLSSNNWLGGWMGLEINMISFIPIIYSNFNYYTSESSMSYFIIQSMSSTLLIFGLVFSCLMNFSFLFDYYFIFISLCMSMGMAPFHMWLPGVVEGTSWESCFLLLTWQKLALLFLISNVLINYDLLILMVMITLIIGSFGGLNQGSLKKIFSYSSINMLGWIMMGMLSSNVMWMVYFIFYSFMIFGLFMFFHLMEINYLNQVVFGSFCSFNKIYFCICMFSIGGLPPLAGFLPKWMIIQSVIFYGNYFVCLIMVLSSLITLFYYIRICYLIILVNSVKMKFNYLSNFNFYLVNYFFFFNLFGFILILFFKTFI